MGAPWIHIDRLVSFDGSGDVLLHQEALDASPEQLYKAVQLAYSHICDEILLNGNHGQGPLANYKNLSYEEYLQIVERARVADAGQKAKRAHMKVRRSGFNSKRSQLFLAMLEAKTPHICAHPTCDTANELTIDHVIPLSRGGTDDLSNLQFLCRTHNSIKNDKTG